MLTSFPSQLQMGLPHQPHTHTHTHRPCGSATPATHTHTQALCSEYHTGRSCDRSRPVSYWCYRTKQFVLRDLTSRMRMTTRGLGVSRLVCKNALHFHLDCSELFRNRITDKCSETIHQAIRWPLKLNQKSLL